MRVAAAATAALALMMFLMTMNSASILRVIWTIRHIPGQQLNLRAAWAAAKLLGRDPIFPWSIALTASQKDERPLAQWQYRRVPFRAHVRVVQRATTNGVVTTIYSGSETIQQQAPEQGGGTIGVTPVHFTTPVKEWIAAAGDEIIVSNTETLAGTPTVDGIVYVDPI
jgi:hypothetical protein